MSYLEVGIQHSPNLHRVSTCCARLSEEEALKKICPMMATVSREGVHAGMQWKDTTPGCCVGSACMMWRWASCEPGEAQTGFCGFAGMPIR